MHLMHHLVEGIKAHGPLYGTWMFPYERFNSWLHRRVMNRSLPEATLIETYRVNVDQFKVAVNPLLMIFVTLVFP